MNLLANGLDECLSLRFFLSGAPLLPMFIVYISYLLKCGEGDGCLFACFVAVSFLCFVVLFLSLFSFWNRKKCVLANLGKCEYVNL